MSQTSSYAPGRRPNHDAREPPPLIDVDSLPSISDRSTPEPRHHHYNNSNTGRPQPRHHQEHSYVDDEAYGLSGMISNWWGRTFGPSRSNSYLSPDSSIHSSKSFPSNHHNGNGSSGFLGGNNGDGITRAYTPSRQLQRPASPFMLPDYDPIVLTGYHPDTGPAEKLLNESVAEAIRIHFPERLRICEEWKLVYSLYQNGSSLATLYKLCEDYRHRRVGFVLVVRDGMGGVSSTPRPVSSCPSPPTRTQWTGPHAGEIVVACGAHTHPFSRNTPASNRLAGHG